MASSDALTAPGKANQPVRLAQTRSPIATALAVSALLHAAVFLILGAAPGAWYARPGLQGSGTAMTIVSLTRALSTDTTDALPGVLAHPKNAVSYAMKLL